MLASGVGGRVAIARHCTDTNYVMWSPIYVLTMRSLVTIMPLASTINNILFIIIIIIVIIIYHYGVRLCDPRSLISIRYTEESSLE